MASFLGRTRPSRESALRKQQAARGKASLAGGAAAKAKRAPISSAATQHRLRWRQAAGLPRARFPRLRRLLEPRLHMHHVLKAVLRRCLGIAARCSAVRRAPSGRARAAPGAAQRRGWPRESRTERPDGR